MIHINYLYYFIAITKGMQIWEAVLNQHLKRLVTKYFHVMDILVVIEMGLWSKNVIKQEGTQLMVNSSHMYNFIWVTIRMKPIYVFCTFMLMQGIQIPSSKLHFIETALNFYVITLQIKYIDHCLTTVFNSINCNCNFLWFPQRSL